MFINKQFEIEKFRRRFSVLFLVTSCLVSIRKISLTRR